MVRDRTLPGSIRIRHWPTWVDMRVVEERRVSTELGQFGVQRPMPVSCVYAASELSRAAKARARLS